MLFEFTRINFINNNNRFKSVYKSNGQQTVSFFLNSNKIICMNKTLDIYKQK